MPLVPRRAPRSSEFCKSRGRSCRPYRYASLFARPYVRHISVCRLVHTSWEATCGTPRTYMMRPEWAELALCAQACVCLVVPSQEVASQGQWVKRDMLLARCANAGCRDTNAASEVLDAVSNKILGGWAVHRSVERPSVTIHTTGLCLRYACR